MIRNYLPFVRQQYFEIPTGTRDYARIPIFSTGGGAKVILDDFSVWQAVPSITDSPLLMRIGVMGYKYFTEDFQAVQAYSNGHRPLCSRWNFPKPYRMYPGQKLRTQITRMQVGSPIDYPIGIMFNGIREKDQRPIILYDTDEEAKASQAVSALNDMTLATPHDSSILLYGVTVSQWSGDVLNRTGVGVQIWGPDDRQWIETAVYDGAPAQIGLRVIGPPTNVMQLGEQNGWVLDPKQTFTVEIINTNAGTEGVYLTLRGVVEVEE